MTHATGLMKTAALHVSKLRCKIPAMKKHSGSSAASCIQVLTEVIDGHRARGVIDTVLVAALGEVAIKTATTDKEMAQIHLDALAAITKAAADAHRGQTVMNMAQAVFGTA